MVRNSAVGVLFFVCAVMLSAEGAYAAPAVSGAQAVNIMGPGAQITWTTDIPSDSTVYYGTTSGSTSLSSSWRCDAGGMVTSHCVNLTELAYSTAYYFTVRSSADGGITWGTAVGSFTSGTSMYSSGSSSTSTSTSSTTSSGTSSSSGTGSSGGDTTAPVLSSVRIENNMGMGAQVMWTTDDASDSRVTYGTASGSLFSSSDWVCGTSGYVTSHCVNLTGLVPGTLYYYKAWARNASNLDSSSGEYSFTAASSTTTYTTSTTTSATTNTTGTATTTTSTAITTTTTSTSTDSSTGTSGTIQGKVVKSNGAGIGNVWVNANQYNTGKWAQTKTGSDGSFSLSVPAGDWMVNVYPEYNSGFAGTQTPRQVTVSAGGTAELSFILESLGARITGSIVDANGQVLADASGYVSTYVEPSAGTGSYTTSMMPAYGGPIEKGMFSFPVPAGSWTLSVYFPSDVKFAAPLPQAVTIGEGETKNVILRAGQNDATISGFLKTSAGTVITALDPSKVKAYVSSRGGSWQNVQVDSQGTFSVQVAAGTWYVGVWADPSTGYTSQSHDVEVIVASGEKRSVDLVLSRADSFVSGTVKAGGAPLANVWVSIDQRSFSSASTMDHTEMKSSPFVGGGSSDAQGNFKIAVPAGSYFVHAFYPQTAGYINPPEASVTVQAGQTAAVDLVFRTADITISGATLMDGKGVSAFVWGWSDSGAYVGTRSDDMGSYSLTVAQNDTWHIAASREGSGTYAKAAEMTVRVDGGSVTQDLVLLPLSTIIAQAVEKVVETVKPQTVELSDGAKTILPANALGSGGSASVTMKPTVEAPSIATASVVGTSYHVEAKDTAGKEITNLNAEITISLPFDETELAAKGLNPDDLVLSYFDETTNSWKSLEKQVVDKQSKTVSAMVNHLTLFALVAPADTTPPAAPSGVSVSVSQGAVKLAWVNPSADFHHAKVYRSTKAGELGTVVANYLTGTSQTDTLTGAAAYYVVRAVDLAGNESANTAQYKAEEGAMTVVQPAVSAAVVLIRVEGDPRVYVVKHNIKRHIPSVAVFNAAKFSWGDVKLVKVSEAAAYAESALMKSPDSPKVYVVESGKKRWIPTAEAFTAAGYQWNLIAEATAAEVAAYPDADSAVSAARELKAGMRGTDVRALQAALTKDKAVYPQGLITGYFGNLTKAAVQKFQTKHKIADTPGVAGAATQAKITELGL